MDDTIAAISTPIGHGGLAVIRLSGPKALAIADTIFVSKGPRPSLAPSHTIHYGQINRQGELIDEVLLSVMRAPRTYTREDVVEISCHGGLLVTQNVLACCLQGGARRAEPGEFTKRAFLNGRIDLTQAEAVGDIIAAKSALSHASAMQTLKGHLSQKVEVIRGRLMDVLAHVEAHIDFPDDEVPDRSLQEFLTDINQAQSEIQHLLATARHGKVLRHGVVVAIVGRPNAGKSSLMNLLLGEDRAIVAPTPGTTRDTIEEATVIHGVPIRLIDTAGIRQARGVVEKFGIARAQQVISSADIRIIVLDSSRRLTRKDVDLIGSCGGGRHLIAINKVDLRRTLILPNLPDDAEVIELSCKTENGIDKLREAILKLALGCEPINETCEFLINERQAEALKTAAATMYDLANDQVSGQRIELLAQGLRCAIGAMDVIVGRVSTDEILDRVFSRFCIGK